MTMKVPLNPKRAQLKTLITVTVTMATIIQARYTFAMISTICYSFK